MLFLPQSLLLSEGTVARQPILRRFVPVALLLLTAGGLLPTLLLLIFPVVSS
jgi:hypothetical protein